MSTSPTPSKRIEGEQMNSRHTHILMQVFNTLSEDAQDSTGPDGIYNQQ